MHLFEKMFASKASVSSQPVVKSPLTGRVIPLSEIPDQVFSQGILGPGCGIEPVQETVYAPFDGKVTQLTETRHAIGLTSTAGIELLIHVGMDTVEMNGDGFLCFVKEGQQIKTGDKLMGFSLEKIKSAGHPATTAVVVTNPDAFPSLKAAQAGDIRQGAPLIDLR